MTTKSEILKGTDDFFNGEYEIDQARVVPSAEDLKFGKYGKEIELTMLFIDIKKSTKIADSVRRTTAARMYKSFLWGVTLIARNNDGDLRSFNGDGVLVAFPG